MDILTTAFHRSVWPLGLLFRLCLGAFLGIGPVCAQLSPGKLAQGHAQLEGLDNCAKCHSNKVRSSADPMLCRDCHTAIDTRMKEGKGLHGKPEFNQCGKCHPDHLGRSFNLVTWKTVGGTREQFDHEKTGYRLDGAHAKVKCADCHQPKNLRDPAILKGSAELQKKTFLGLGTECLACHKDVHGKLFPQKKCMDCHTMDKWKPAKGFDHNQDTRYDLRGKHVDLECKKCHTKGDPWKWPVQQKLRDHGCAACHKDVHNGKFGRDCAKCHQEEGFKKVKVTGFDHSKTKFPLEGKHADVNCNQCHKNGNSWVLTRFQRCNDCHGNFHGKEFTKTQRPERCEDCHSVQGFLPANYGVREHNQTDFKLADAHLAIPCAACHTTTVNSQNEVVKRKFKFASMDCIACHDDPHQKQVDKYNSKSGCLSCHSGATWREIRFDHDQTGYKLTGRHQKVGCVGCHSDGFDFKLRSGNLVQVPDFSKRKSQCFECHEDKHLGQFKERDEKEKRMVVRCDKCHTTTDWFAESFDHNKQSRFKLDGAHERARCDACHTTQKVSGKTIVRYKPIGMECRTCHADTLRFR
jgi:Cytochrome c7 and related cytochrome c